MQRWENPTEQRLARGCGLGEPHEQHLGLAKPRAEEGRHFDGETILQHEDIAARMIEARALDLRAAVSIDESDFHVHALPVLLDAATYQRTSLEHVGDAVWGDLQTLKRTHTIFRDDVQCAYLVEPLDETFVWVRPRDPWMLNRAVVQPDPAVAIGLAADTMAAAADAASLDDLFVRLEAVDVMLRIDRDVVPTMAKAPTASVRRRRRTTGAGIAVCCFVYARVCRTYVLVAPCPSSAFLNCATVAKRSAGTFSRACMIAPSSSSGTVPLTIWIDGGISIVCRAMIAIALGPVNGTSPTSISYSTHARLYMSLRPST